MLERLMRVISIYQEHQSKFHNVEALGLAVKGPTPPLPPRKQNSGLATKIVAEWVTDMALKVSPDATPLSRSRSASQSSSALDKILQRLPSSDAIPDELRFLALSENTDLMDKLARQNSTDLLCNAPEESSYIKLKRTKKQKTPRASSVENGEMPERQIDPAL